MKPFFGGRYDKCVADDGFSFAIIESDATSGAVNITTSVLLEAAECDSVSGNITLTIPEGNGFTAELDTVSGKFNCDLPVVMRGDKRIHGDGSAELEFDTTSADVTVKY